MYREPVAYAAIATDGSESVYVASLKEQAEAACREYGWMLVPLYPAPPTWQEEAVAVDTAFERSGVKRTWPDDEPDQIIGMVNAMADEIELLRGYRDEAESDVSIAHLLVDRLRAEIATLRKSDPDSQRKEAEMETAAFQTEIDYQAEIDRLRLTKEERKTLKAVIRALYSTDYDVEYVTLQKMLERLGGFP